MKLELLIVQLSFSLGAFADEEKKIAVSIVFTLDNGRMRYAKETINNVFKSQHKIFTKRERCNFAINVSHKNTFFISFSENSHQYF